MTMLTSSPAEVVAPRERADDLVLVEVRVIEADDSYVTHWPCGVVLSTRFDGVAWICPRCGRMR